MRSLVYTSTEARPISDAELAEILVIGRERNAAVGVTGILAHRDSNCLGVLEGDDDAVWARFEQIKADSRHTNVRVLCDDPITYRAFPDWSMAFQPLDPLVRNVPGFVDLFATDRRPDVEIGESRARALLEWFRRHPMAPLTTRSPETSTRDVVINSAIALLHEIGPERLTMSGVAERAGITMDDLEAVFPTRSKLLVSTVRRWIKMVAAPLEPIAAEHGVVAYLHALIGAYAEEPALDRAIVSCLAAAADPGAPDADLYRGAYIEFRASIRDALVADVQSGREPSTMDPERGAHQLMALYDGLRIQALLIPGVDVVDEFDRAVTRMRRGWAEEYEQPGFFAMQPA